MAALQSQSVSVAGLTPAYSAASAGGDTAPVGDRNVLAIKNADVAAVTVTLATPGNLESGDAYPDKVYTVPAAGELLVPLLALYRDRTDGAAHISYSATASVTVAVLHI